MTNAYRCDGCQEFVEGRPAGELTECAEDYVDQESHDLCSDCLGKFVGKLENESLAAFAGGEE